MKVKVKQMNGSDLEVEVESGLCTVGDVRTEVSSRLDISPDTQRLIHAGRVLRDDMTLDSCGIADGGVIHLVIRPDPPPSNGTEGDESFRTTSTGVSTGEPQRRVRIQNLGNGVTVGSFTIDQDNLQDTGSLPAFISDMLSNILPTGTSGESASSRSGNNTNGAESVPTETAGNGISTINQRDRQSQVQRDLFLAESHLRALESGQSSNQMPSNLSNVLELLSTSLHYSSLPALRLAHSIERAQYPDAANLSSTQAEVYRMQTMLEHLSIACEHLSYALQDTTVNQLFPQANTSSLNQQRSHRASRYPANSVNPYSTSPPVTNRTPSNSRETNNGVSVAENYAASNSNDRGTGADSVTNNASQENSTESSRAQPPHNTSSSSTESSNGSNLNSNFGSHVVEPILQDVLGAVIQGASSGQQSHSSQSRTSNLQFNPGQILSQLPNIVNAAMNFNAPTNSRTRSRPNNVNHSQNNFSSVQDQRTTTHEQATQENSSSSANVEQSSDEDVVDDVLDDFEFD